MRKLIKGKQVVANGRTYKESVPESVIKALGLKDDIFEPVVAKQENKQQYKASKRP